MVALEALGFTFTCCCAGLNWEIIAKPFGPNKVSLFEFDGSFGVLVMVKVAIFLKVFLAIITIIHSRGKIKIIFSLLCFTKSVSGA